MSQLVVFMDKLVRELEEGMPVPRKVRLIAEGTTFETWEPIHGVGIEPETWAKDAELLIQAMLAELPKRRVQLSFIAEDSLGGTISTHLRTVTGQNASVQDLGTQNGAKALADALASVAKTADSVLESARKMLDFQADQLQKKEEQLHEAHEVFMAIRKVELEGAEQESVVGKVMTEQLQNALPLLMQLGEHMIKNAGTKNSIGGAAASVANAATNGAS